MSEHWNRYNTVWNRLGPPLRPTAETVEAYRAALGDADARVMLYGVTPELAVLGRDLVAVDGSAGMIARVWPGDTARRRAVLADWLRLPFPDGSLTAAVGDGTPNNIPFPAANAALLDELARVVAPGGRVVFRAFCTPETLETLEAVRAAAFDGGIASFHALKWRVAMACMDGPDAPNIRVADILASFNATFPDRAALAAATGWSFDAITTIDAYTGSTQVYSFPTLAQILRVVGERFDDVTVLASGGYPLSERCPLIAFRNRRGPGQGDCGRSDAP